MSQIMRRQILSGCNEEVEYRLVTNAILRRHAEARSFDDDLGSPAFQTPSGNPSNLQMTTVNGKTILMRVSKICATTQP